MRLGCGASCGIRRRRGSTLRGFVAGERGAGGAGVGVGGGGVVTLRETVASVVGAALWVLRSKNRDMRANVEVRDDGEDVARRTRGDRGVADGGRSSSSSGGGSGGRGEVVVEGAVGRVVRGKCCWDRWRQRTLSNRRIVERWHNACNVCRIVDGCGVVRITVRLVLEREMNLAGDADRAVRQEYDM